MKQFILLLGLLLSSNLYAQQDLAVFLDDLTTLQADFIQRLYADKGELLEETEGKMSIQRPNHFRWIYQKPYQQRIIANGQLVWIYDEDLEQVTIKDFNTALGKTPALLLTSTQLRVEQDFKITKLNSESEYTRLQLEPKGEETQFEKIILTLKGVELHGLDLIDNLEQTTTMHFKNIQRNKQLNKKLFQFVPPANVDIIDETK